MVEYHTERPSSQTRPPTALYLRVAHSIPTSARSGLSLAAETEQKVLEPGQVLLALGGRLGPRVLEVDEGADPLPRCTLGERVGQLGLERLFVVPARFPISTGRETSENRSRQRRKGTRTCSARWPFPSWRCSLCKSCRWRSGPLRSCPPSCALPPLPAWQCRPFVVRASYCARREYRLSGPDRQNACRSSINRHGQTRGSTACFC